MSELIAFCLTCSNYDVMSMDGNLSCKKFPDGVPDEILLKGDCDFWEDMFEDDEED